MQDMEFLEKEKENRKIYINKLLKLPRLKTLIALKK